MVATGREKNSPRGCERREWMILNASCTSMSGFLFLVIGIIMLFIYYYYLKYQLINININTTTTIAIITIIIIKSIFFLPKQR